MPIRAARIGIAARNVRGALIKIRRQQTDLLK
jgi:hypothetical protein